MYFSHLKYIKIVLLLVVKNLIRLFELSIILDLCYMLLTVYGPLIIWIKKILTDLFVPNSPTIS